MALDRVEYIAYRRLPGLIDARRVLAGGGAKPRGEFTPAAAEKKMVMVDLCG